MKLYILPIGSACNAKCRYCITRFRKMKNDVLDLKRLAWILTKNDYDKIEITGGGEPALHQQIHQIIKLCANKCPTNIYTNGTYIPYSNSVQVCLSRAHYDDDKNREIMGVIYDINKFSQLNNLKMSLMLHKSGISTTEELKKYLKWADRIASKVVVRQLFDYEDEKYLDYFTKEYISSVDLAKKFGEIYPFEIIDGNYFFDINGLEVEFEGRSCACEDVSPVLTADGTLRKGWAEL
jgi:organic radical activating enzyme